MSRWNDKEKKGTTEPNTERESVIEKKKRRGTRLVSPSTICQLISNKMTRPRHGVSSPPGIAVPTASIECNAPVRRFLTCTFEGHSIHRSVERGRDQMLKPRDG